jgi:hypothetical protein
MRKALAVALLDWRRLGLSLASAALVAGLVPALASGLGVKIPAATLLTLALALVGVASGGYFGSDFAEGRSSFFFARPLSAAALIGGRFTGLLAVAAGAVSSFTASYWLSSRGSADFHWRLLAPSHGEALGVAWILSLFFGLAVAARSRGEGSPGWWRTMVMFPLRLGLALGAFILVFGLFADLVLRAYSNDPTPIRLFARSWVAAGLVASCVAIAGGRTERLRIWRLQSRVMIGHFALVSAVVLAAWAYVLHPGPAAIQRVDDPVWGSPDGRLAYVTARVDRGGGSSFRPVFVLDIAAGKAVRLNADPRQGPWTSADGGIMVWSEATPFFFRPLWRYMGGATSFRVRDASGQVAPLPMPKNLPDFLTARDLSSFAGMVDRVLPSPDGNTFAILWDRHLTFTSRSRGELSDVNLGSGRPTVRQAAFLPSGNLRAALSRRDASGAASLEFVDIDPDSGSIKAVASMDVESPARIQFDGPARRALLTSVTQAGQGAAISLIDFDNGAGHAGPTVLLKGVLFPGAIFLSDGLIAATSGGSAGAWDRRVLRIFSPAGQMLGDIQVGTGTAPRLGNEMFPGVLGVSTSGFAEELSLIDIESGAVLRRLPGLYSPGNFWSSPPAGSPAARLVQSKDGRLYEIPSPTAEPRLLLPRSPN